MFYLSNKLNVKNHSINMLLFINTVTALFFYHRYTQQYLGVVKRPNYPYELVAPVESAEFAVDFHIRDADAPRDQAYHPVTLFNIKDSPSGRMLRITHALRNFSFERCCEDRLDNRLILAPTDRNGERQQFTISMMSDFSFTIQIAGKCVQFDDVDRNFVIAPCGNIQRSSFYFYLDKKAADRSLDSLVDDTPFYVDELNPRSDRNVTKLIFKNGKAIRIDGKKKDEHLKFDHKVVDIKEIVKLVRKVHSREPSAEHDSNDSFNAKKIFDHKQHLPPARKDLSTEALAIK